MPNEHVVADAKRAFQCALSFSLTLLDALTHRTMSTPLIIKKKKSHNERDGQGPGLPSAQTGGTHADWKSLLTVWPCVWERAVRHFTAMARLEALCWLWLGDSEIHRTSGKSQSPTGPEEVCRTVFLVPVGFIVGVRLCHGIRRVVAEFASLMVPMRWCTTPAMTWFSERLFWSRANDSFLTKNLDHCSFHPLREKSFKVGLVSGFRSGFRVRTGVKVHVGVSVGVFWVGPFYFGPFYFGPVRFCPVLCFSTLAHLDTHPSHFGPLWPVSVLKS